MGARSWSILRAMIQDLTPAAWSYSSLTIQSVAVGVVPSVRP